jgi:hypothetical protein
VWKYGDPLDGTEFTGGSVTGPVFHMSDIGMLLFVVAVLMAFVSRKISGAVAVAASLLCLPLYLYFTFPGPFRWVFRGVYKSPIHASLVLERWAMMGILALVIAASFGVRALLGRVEKSPRG